ncbi:MAG: hypothetical protein JNL80_07590 [Phycisphaerae bacterium]|jgi:hypothetical protein|nr:hypothetical protein [Phycisphaerae bacterium]
MTPRRTLVSLASCIGLLSATAAALPVSILRVDDATSAAIVRPERIAWTQRIESHVAAVRQRTLDACTAKGISLPSDFLAWIDGDSLLRMSVYGCRRDPLPVLLQLRSLEIDLGADVVRRDYTQLALAFAINGSYQAPKKKASGWNDGDAAAPSGELPDVSPRAPLRLVIPGDPRVPVDTKDASRTLDRDDHIINFLEDHEEIEVEVQTKELPPLEYDDNGVAKPRGKPVDVVKKVRRGLVGADVIASAALQTEFNEYMKAHGHADIQLDCGDRVVHWKSTEAVGDEAPRKRIAAAHELFHAAYRAKGRMPADRDAAPTPSESMAWFIRNDRHPFTDEERAARKWPLFPLNAPWPVLLMLVADDQPLREREAIWTSFRDNGEMKTYGEYIGGIAQQFDMQSARRVSPFAYSYGSIQMMWKDGGVCGTMGNIGARTYRICGVPSSTAGQPGHCALVLMERDPTSGAFRCVGGQYATGGDEVTTVHAGWNYDDVGGRRPMVFHQAMAWGVNAGLASLVETLVMRRAWDALSPEDRQRDCIDLVDTGLARNPFALPLVEAAIASAADAPTLVRVLDTFNTRVADATDAKAHELYRTTVRDLVHARIAALPAPATREASVSLLSELERQQCDLPKLLARCWREIDGESGFTARCRAEVERYLASPTRTKNKKASQQFADRIKAWGQTVKGKEAKAAWASAVLDAFSGKEQLTLKGKASLDPSVAALCSIAGREPPAVAGGS